MSPAIQETLEKKKKASLKCYAAYKKFTELKSVCVK